MRLRRGHTHGPAVAHYLVGTDERVLASTMAGPGSEWHDVVIPAGQQHAVPIGEQLALCGASPVIVWQSLAFTGRSDPCPVCLRMTAGIV